MDVVVVDVELVAGVADVELVAGVADVELVDTDGFDVK